MLTTTPLLPVLFATAVTARLAERTVPDDVSEAFVSAGLPVPLVVSDTVFAPPAGSGAEVPAGLLLWAAGLRRAGAVRVRAEPVHPSLPLRVPRLDRDGRRATARASARTRALCVVEDADGAALAVAAVGLEGDVVVVPCAPSVFTTVDHTTPAEASRRLRESVMHALAAVEAHGQSFTDADSEPLADLPWRDWQADLSGDHDDTQHAALALLTGDHDAARSLHTALHVHGSLSSLAVPAQTGGPVVGPALAEVHSAAARVITALTRLRIES
ncbi:MAG: hypothetical protein ACTHVY_01530 [Brevibacterium yomogidense]|uniref:hypothetical protein n=1 Tax=Brevibacterium sp. Mu109 TaxID=1255669 RepID=UPI000C43C90B|nr:hypothetical protein [Brevibacterium sp. Mu109]SMX67405.1 hypothetical protein BSP109_00358 [Brevibacterium sp. Mu109]